MILCTIQDYDDPSTIQDVLQDYSYVSQEFGRVYLGANDTVDKCFAGQIDLNRCQLVSDDVLMWKGMETCLLNSVLMRNLGNICYDDETRRHLREFVGGNLGELVQTGNTGIGGSEYKRQYKGLARTNEITNAVNSGFCQTNFNNQQNTRDIIANQDANTRAILERLTQDKIDSLRDENQALRLSASQTAQNQYLVNELRPCPAPAYVVPNPYAYTGCNCGC